VLRAISLLKDSSIGRGATKNRFPLTTDVSPHPNYRDIFQTQYLP